MAGLAVAYNASRAPSNVVTLEKSGDMAILVPNTTASSGGNTISTGSVFGMAFTFTTYGARASCAYLNDKCHLLNDLYGVYFVVNCTVAGWPSLPVYTSPDDVGGGGAFSDTRVFSVRNGSWGNLTSTVSQSVQQFPDNTWSPNPATIGIQLETPVAASYSVNNISSTALADYDGFSFAGCSLEYFNITAAYNPISNSYSIVDSISAAPYFTTVLLEPLISQFANDKLVADATPAIIFSDPNTFNAVLSQDLGRMAVAWTSGLFVQVPALAASNVDVHALGAYPMAPVIVITTLLYLYALLTLSVFFTSRTLTSYNISLARPSSSHKIGAVALGQKWLTNPIPLIAMTFPERDGEDGARSVASRSVGMVDDVHGDRLLLGLHSNEQGEMTFGLRKRAVGQASC